MRRGCCALLALATHNAADAGFSTSGSGAPVHNKAGALGAWLADVALLPVRLFGLVVLAGRRCAPGSARWRGCCARRRRRAGRSGAHAAPGVLARPACCCWPPAARSNGRGCTSGKAASAGGHAGGVLGYLLGPLSDEVARLRRLGRAVDRRAGARRRRWRSASRGCASPSASARAIESLRERRVEAHRARRGRAPRRARRMREREEVRRGRARAAIEDHLPIVIEPPVVEVPKSERVVKERQKPLFSELADTKLPQVDLLDAAPAAQETVTRRDARDDLAPDREEAEGLRRRGARGRRLAGPGDHALRDRAGHRRQGLADRQPGEGPGALAVAWCRSAWSRRSPARTTWRSSCPTPSGRRSACPRSSARRSTTTRRRS